MRPTVLDAVGKGGEDRLPGQRDRRPKLRLRHSLEAHQQDQVIWPVGVETRAGSPTAGVRRADDRLQRGHVIWVPPRLNQPSLAAPGAFLPEVLSARACACCASASSVVTWNARISANVPAVPAASAAAETARAWPKAAAPTPAVPRPSHRRSARTLDGGVGLAADQQRRAGAAGPVGADRRAVDREVLATERAGARRSRAA